MYVFNTYIVFILGDLSCMESSDSFSDYPYALPLNRIIIHQTHNEKSDWSRAFNQLTIACELDMINAISAADIAFIMSSSTSAWLLSPLECSPQKQNGRTLRLRMNYMCKCVIKQFLDEVEHDIMNYQNLVSVLSASAFGFGR